MDISNVGASPVQKPSYFDEAEAKKRTGAMAEIVDSAEISESSKQMSQLENEIESIRKRIDSLPDIREGKIMPVIEKIENGYYESEEFIEEFAA